MSRAQFRCARLLHPSSLDSLRALTHVGYTSFSLSVYPRKRFGASMALHAILAIGHRQFVRWTTVIGPRNVFEGEVWIYNACVLSCTADAHRLTRRRHRFLAPLVSSSFGGLSSAWHSSRPIFLYIFFGNGFFQGCRVRAGVNHSLHLRCFFFLSEY